MDDYPAELRNAPPDSLGDGRGYQNRECTSAVAWWAHLAGVELHDYGNASNWPAAAAGRSGYPVDTQPEVGAVAVFRPGIAGAGPYGHVAYVVGVGNGWITVEDYNYTGSHVYALHTLAPAGLLFIHLPSRAPVPPIPEDDMPLTDRLTLFYRRVGGVSAVFVGDYMHVRHVRDEATLAALQWAYQQTTGRAIAVFGDASHPVNDPLAFGVPADAETAAALGVSYP